MSVNHLLKTGLGRMDETLEARGLWPDVESPWVRWAMTELARHQFAPAVVWFWDGRTWVAVDRTAQPGRWADLVYPEPEESTVTQVTDGLATSSLSCVSVVADMLDSLTLEPGHRVLDLGTGAGWNAALLAHRTGPDGQVVSVEADPALAAAAARRLERAGLDVDVRTGDGTDGAPDAGPYDRLIATYAVETVPWRWIEQVRPGGRLVVPWGRMGHFALTVAEDGQSASGWLQGLGLFMKDRNATEAVPAQHAVTPNGGAAATNEELFDDLLDAHALFALRVSHPHIVVTVDRRGAAPCAELRDAADRSVRAERGDGDLVSLSGDAQDLWSALRHGHQLWCERGRPPLWDYGMTVTRQTQTVWAGSESTGPYAR
ncbi:methyltransferase domain-containing protein [Streptomyces sp. BE147]|uniref:methyltransferase domain-containing protein n=1 Tax=Streptomyces sp. BE147 TaxID=3002524 RepID=UPI002E76365B|nr:methyltransferase domain-containing protein [Streptomyces sp. BE147]MEE1736427.1 methyltransferase domain-containing protein [Streptomyces sp. BE147]